MRSRPDIVDMRVTIDARPGQTLEAEAVLKSPSDTPVNSITMKLLGQEWYRYGSNQSAVKIRTIFTLIATVKRSSTLEKGNHVFRARFPLPPDIPPTYKGTHFVVQYTLALHVDIPWWPDRLQDYVVRVAPPIVSRPKRSPLAQTTARGGDAPFIELTLDDTTIAPGDTLSGALALANLRGRRVKGLRMALVSLERQTGGPVMRAVDYPVHFAPDAVREGREFPFRFTIDKSVPPGFVSPLAQVSYMLEVRAEVAWGKDLVHAAPITLAALDRPQEGVRSRQRLGLERWRRVWEQAGAPAGLSLTDPEDLRLGGAINDVKISIFMDPDAETPSFVAQIEWSPWDLDLRIQLRTLSILASDPDGDGFGRRYKVRGRDPAQVRPLITGPLRKALLAFEEIYVDDKHARVRSKARAFDQPYIGNFIANTIELARELAAAGGRIPPPPAMAAMLPNWRAFADETSANLSVGSMSLRGGTLDGARFDVETTFSEDDPSPKTTRLSLLPDPPLPEALDVASDEAWLKAPPGAKELAAEVQRGSVALRITPGAMEVDLEAPLPDPASLRPKMEAMLALARRLRGEKAAGPYR